MKSMLRRIITTGSIFFFILLMSLTTNGQTGWQQVYTGGSWAVDMSFVPGSDNAWETGWVLQANSSIVKTTDGGDTWTLITQSAATNCNGICFVNENIGYISSASGDIIKSTDGGLTWTSIYSNSSDWFGLVAFKDSLNGVVVGIPGKYTTDGGATWTNTSGSTDYDRVDYAGGSTYFSGRILQNQVGKSTDNGVTWTNVNSNVSLPITIEFYNENFGLAGGANFTLQYTTNGGSSWTEKILNGGSGDLLSAGYFDEDTVYVAGSQKVYKSTDGCNTWDEDSTFNGVIFRAMFVTPTNVVYLGGDPMQIWRKVGTPPLTPEFEASDTLICSGSSVDFTDHSFGLNISSWSWTFEGGTPSTSTDQNPTVLYNTGGTFDVTLTITDDNGTDSVTYYDYITVLEIPAQADMPDGEQQVCTGQYYSYSVPPVEFAEDYDWELSPADAGTLIVDENTATLEVADDWTGDFTLRVRATNMCGDGDWSDELQGTVYESPAIFNLEGGGGYCQGEDGVEITLDGSQISVSYELLLDGEATGNVVEGTGSGISFGLVTDEGFYTCAADNSNCEELMTGQVQVEMLFPPLEPGTPEGPDVICDDTISAYTSTGSNDADSYTWELSPEEAGTITSDGLDATVEWDSGFVGIASISLYGINDCGAGNSSAALEVSVGNPHPEIAGESLVCDWSEEIYTVEEHEGSTYTWDVTGGNVTDGQGTSTITVAWSGEGEGTIVVEEETIDGCLGSSEILDIVIDDCTNIPENVDENAIQIYPNPAGDLITIAFKSNETVKGELMITNQIGQIVFKQELSGNNKIAIDLTPLKSGAYIIRMKIDNGQTINKQFFKK